MNKNSQLTMIFDSCNSGTAADLKYELKLVYEPSKPKNKRVAKWISYPVKEYTDTPGQVILISGCQDPQTSADAYIGGKNQGALTYSLLKCLKNDQIKSWQQLLYELRRLLKQGGYTQIANLTTGKQIQPSATISLF